MSRPRPPITDWNRLEQLLAESGSGRTRNIDVSGMQDHLRLRVKGQDHVIDDVVRLIRLQWAKEKRERPIANFLFLGPTGTGKTELAKAMAEYLYEDEKNMLRFDCSELGSMGKTQLIGTTLGYVGSEQGGKLTRPMLASKKRLVLFDEIEKAAQDVFDLFLQMMGEGRLTEQGSGQVADFTESIIVLTSNAQAEAIGKIQEQVPDYDEMVNAVKSHLADTKTFRPEIVGRIDKVYVFRPLEGRTIGEIALSKMGKLANSYGIALEEVQADLVYQAMQRGNKLSRFGVRELDRVIEDMLAEGLVAAKEKKIKRVSLLLNRGDIELVPIEDSPQT